MKRKRHAGAEARRKNERTGLPAEAAAAVDALAAVADPGRATSRELARALVTERQAAAGEIERAKAAPIPERGRAMEPLRARVGRILTLEEELSRRPSLVRSETGETSQRARPLEQPPETAPVRDGWEPVLPVLPPSLGTLSRASLQDVFNEHGAALRALRAREIGGELTDEQRAVEVEIGRYEQRLLRDWLTGNGQARERAAQSWLARTIDDLAVRAGIARRTPTGATVTLSKEEEMQLTLARRRRARGPEPRGLSVAAAVAHWLAGDEGWVWVAGTSQEVATLEDRDIAALLIVLGLIARDGDSGSVTVRARSPLSGTRIRCEGFSASVEHLARNGFLTVERRLPDLLISYGPLVLDIAREAGIDTTETT